MQQTPNHRSNQGVDPDLLAQFDALSDDLPSKIVEEIFEFENNHAQVVLKKYGRFVSQFEAYFDLLVKVIHATNYIDHHDWPTHRGIQFTILTHNVKPIFSSFNRLIRGDYENCFALCRVAYEAYIKCIYVSCFPARSYSAVHKQKDGGREFNLTNFIKNDLGLPWSEYMIMSSMAHANQYSVLNSIIERQESSNPQLVSVLYKYDDKNLQLGINYILYLEYVFCKLTVELFATSTNEVLTEKMVTKMRHLVDIREIAFASNWDAESQWPEIMNDTQDIFNMVTRADKGEDWEKAWKEIRLERTNRKPNTVKESPGTIPCRDSKTKTAKRSD